MCRVTPLAVVEKQKQCLIIKQALMMLVGLYGANECDKYDIIT